MLTSLSNGVHIIPDSIGCIHVAYFDNLMSIYYLKLQCSFVCMCVRACVLACARASVCMPACLPACLPVCLSVCLPACLPACLPVCLSVCLYVCLSVCLSVCMYVPPFRHVRRTATKFCMHMRIAKKMDTF